MQLDKILRSVKVDEENPNISNGIFGRELNVKVEKIENGDVDIIMDMRRLTILIERNYDSIKNYTEIWEKYRDEKKHTVYVFENIPHDAKKEVNKFTDEQKKRFIYYTDNLEHDIYNIMMQKLILIR